MVTESDWDRVTGKTRFNSVAETRADARIKRVNIFNDYRAHLVIDNDDTKAVSWFRVAVLRVASIIFAAGLLFIAAAMLCSGGVLSWLI